jgi:hypothetical protein
MGRGRDDWKAYWHHRRVPLPDGDELLYVVIDRKPPGRTECTRTVRRGAIHQTVAHRLLLELGHPDADLPIRDDWVTL